MNKREFGNKGEDIAKKFLENKGFIVADRNYRKKWGELDIIAIKDNIIHFFEVKSVTCYKGNTNFNVHRPEDNVDGFKVKHLRRIIETYLEEKSGSLVAEFKVHVICVFMDMDRRSARVEWIENVIL